MVASLCGFLCAATESFSLLVAARFLQGLSVPAITTCLVVFLARRLPPDRLNVAMGSYVSATVAGGLGGRLLAGFIHPPLHWRYAFVTASVLLLLGTLDALRWLREEKPPTQGGEEADFVATHSRPEPVADPFSRRLQPCGIPFRLQHVRTDCGAAVSPSHTH
jgi:YNFM family putative membrane transporter